eukprot:comp18355_c0_seq1/m.19491 comp18355_c0_seq1/g.19491  ORF comp18355_c0_seq1/g.19491 comp18355_c0_seq1/m.19491 type:complete len:377 (-) comp18355_c0_seq1:225-1355(-)
MSSRSSSKRDGERFSRKREVERPLTEKEKKEQHEGHMRLLQELTSDGDNQFCADCGMKGPRWASWNLGAFLCIRCAGLHRNIGVHISKVKSTNLDTWTPEQIESMKKKGNTYVNDIYEACLPPDFRRPVNDFEADSFIKAKYVRKEYVDRPAKDAQASPKPGDTSSGRDSSRPSSRSSRDQKDRERSDRSERSEKSERSGRRPDEKSSSSRSRDKEYSRTGDRERSDRKERERRRRERTPEPSDSDSERESPDTKNGDVSPPTTTEVQTVKIEREYLTDEDDLGTEEVQNLNLETGRSKTPTPKTENSSLIRNEDGKVELQVEDVLVKVGVKEAKGARPLTKFELAELHGKALVGNGEGAEVNGSYGGTLHNDLWS